MGINGCGEYALTPLLHMAQLETYWWKNTWD